MRVRACNWHVCQPTLLPESSYHLIAPDFYTSSNIHNSALQHSRATENSQHNGSLRCLPQSLQYPVKHTATKHPPNNDIKMSTPPTLDAPHRHLARKIDDLCPGFCPLAGLNRIECVSDQNPKSIAPCRRFKRDEKNGLLQVLNEFLS